MERVAAARAVLPDATGWEDPEQLLNGERQWTVPWGGSEDGARVEFEADPADDVDFDAVQRAILVIPTAVANVRPTQPEAIDTSTSLSQP